MATSIDQAFRKAYAKRKPAVESSGPADDSTGGNHVVWIDEPTGQIFRNELGHAVGAPYMNRPAGSDSPAATEAISAEPPSLPVVDVPAPQATASPASAGGEIEKSPLTPNMPLNVRSGTTAYDAWSERLQTFDLPTKDKPASVGETLPPEPSVGPQTEDESPNPLPEFTPVWEVDEFLIPEVARRLVDQHLQPMGAQLERASREGLQVLAVTSQNRGTGRSTVAVAVAESAAAAGLRVALVDADTENPALVDQLQLELSSDWVDAVSRGKSVEEAAVYSLGNKFCFVPLLPKSPEQLKHVDQSAAVLLKQLKHHFDLIVVDFGPLHRDGFGLSIPLSDELFDAVVLIEDMQRIDTGTLESYARRIRAVGIENIGLIENFADVDAASV